MDAKAEKLFDERHMDEMHRVPQRGGFFKGPPGPTRMPKCSMCQEEMLGHRVIINGVQYCEPCFNSKKH
jgi:formylmethanofuran dehydrogenase subunit E